MSGQTGFATIKVSRRPLQQTFETCVTYNVII